MQEHLAENLKLVMKHNAPVIAFGQFNEPKIDKELNNIDDKSLNHHFTLSNDGNLKELQLYPEILDTENDINPDLDKNNEHNKKMIMENDNENLDKIDDSNIKSKVISEENIYPKVLVDVLLSRPSDNFLKDNQHTFKVQKLGEKYRISKHLIIHYNEGIKILSKNKNTEKEEKNNNDSFSKSYFIFGYEDGLICIWSQYTDDIDNYNIIDENDDNNEINDFDRKYTKDSVSISKKQSQIMNIENQSMDDYDNHFNNDDNNEDIEDINHKYSVELKEKSSKIGLESHTINSLHTDKSKQLHFINNTNLINNIRDTNLNKIKTDNSQKQLPKNIYPVGSSKHKFYELKTNFSLISSDYNKSYVNIFNLELVLIGQVGKILALELIKNMYMLASTSEEKTLKLWDLSIGIPLYTFNLDISLNTIFHFTKPNTEISVLNLFSKEPFMIQLNLKKEPFAFNTSLTKFNDLTKATYVVSVTEHIPEDPKAKKKKPTDTKPKKGAKVVKGPKPIIITKEYIVFGSNQGYIIVFDKDFTYLKEIRVNGVKFILKIFQYQSYYVIISNNLAYFCKIDFDASTVDIVFSVPISEDMPNNSYLVENTLYICSEDSYVYKLDLQREINIFDGRMEMIEEDRLSNEMNILYLKSLNKKKKRGKSGKKGGKSKPKK